MITKRRNICCSNRFLLKYYSASLVRYFSFRVKNSKLKIFAEHFNLYLSLRSFINILFIIFVSLDAQIVKIVFELYCNMYWIDIWHEIIHASVTYHFYNFEHISFRLFCLCVLCRIQVSFMKNKSQH